MKKALFTILLILMITAGCVPVMTTPSVPNEPPVAYIDSISSTRILKGTTVTFIGHGIDPDGTVVAYQWRSSIDGMLSAEASFETSSLSEGKNTVYFKVQDNYGDWSRELHRDITVRPVGLPKPVVNSFGVIPRIINKGEAASLAWDVSGATTVTIDQEIGDVALIGSRAVYPIMTTLYKLTATNESGTVTTTTEIVVTSEPLRTVEMSSSAAENGYVRKDTKTGLEPKVGDTISGVPMQAFLSFDISMIPDGSVIKAASIDLSHYIMYGNPFGSLGAMGVFNDQYDELDSGDFVLGEDLFGGYPGGAMIIAPTRPNFPYASDLIASAVQKQVDAGESRFQIRVQFNKYTFHDRQADYLTFISDETKLLVTYKE